MVNNAGIAPAMDFLGVSDEIFDRVMAVNLRVPSSAPWPRRGQ